MPRCAALPIVGATVLSRFGPRRAGQHYGVDLRATEGTPVRAVLDGKVRIVAPNGQLDRYGVTVVIDHGMWLSLSSHLRDATVRAGQRVEAGQQIGTVGRTAGTRDNPQGTFSRDPPHLHLEFLDQWPVVSGGRGRLDPSVIFAELGIVAPEVGPLASTCSPGGEFEVVESPPSSGSDLSDLLVVGAVLYALSRWRGAAARS